jgi:hypothetical protein
MRWPPPHPPSRLTPGRCRHPQPPPCPPRPPHAHPADDVSGSLLRLLHQLASCLPAAEALARCVPPAVPPLAAALRWGTAAAVLALEALKRALAPANRWRDSLVTGCLRQGCRHACYVLCASHGECSKGRRLARQAGSHSSPPPVRCLHPHPSIAVWGWCPSCCAAWTGGVAAKGRRGRRCGAWEARRARAPHNLRPAAPCYGSQAFPFPCQRSPLPDPPLSLPPSLCTVLYRRRRSGTRLCSACCAWMCSTCWHWRLRRGAAGPPSASVPCSTPRVRPPPPRLACALHCPRSRAARLPGPRSPIQPFRRCCQPACMCWPALALASASSLFAHNPPLLPAPADVWSAYAGQRHDLFLPAGGSNAGGER